MMPAVAAEPRAKTKKKLFYKIDEVSKLTRLKAYVLRYWETEFPQLKPEKDKNDQRRYRQKDIDLVLKIKRLLYEEKFTIAGAKQQIAEEMGGATATRASRAKATPQAAPKPKTRAKARPAAKPAPVAGFPVGKIRREISAIRSEIEGLMALL